MRLKLQYCQLTLFVLFSCIILLFQRKLSLNIATVGSHESFFDETNTALSHAERHQLNAALQQKEEESKNVTKSRIERQGSHRLPPSKEQQQVKRRSTNNGKQQHASPNLRGNHNTNNKTRTSPNVLYTVFCGRKNRLMLQEPYWDEMHRLGQINEVHLWNYTLNDVYTQENLAYLRHVERKYSFVTIMEPSAVEMPETMWYDLNHSLATDAIAQDEHGRATFRWPGVRWYTEYYRYYSVHPYDGVIIKADDDIVYVNSTQVRPFADYLWNHPQIFLLSASVINQGLCAHYQQVHGAIPHDLMELPLPGNGMGNLHDNATNALKLHLYFLQNPNKFYIPQPEYYPFGFTINVNFIAIRGGDFYKTFELIQEMLVEQGRYYDEGAITWEAIRKRKYEEGIYMPLVVAHATFGIQKQVIRKVLDAYFQYGKTQRADLYGDILEDWSPQGEK